VNDRNTLVLTETGVEHRPDGSIAVNVGPIVRALRFLTEDRGEDRGTDETGSPLPDLMGLAFDVVESIVLGGRKAEQLRRLKRELDAQGGSSSQSSLVLAKRARRIVPSAQATALDRAADALQTLLGELRGLSRDENAERELSQALEAFQSFGADRWVSATTQLLVAANALGVARQLKPSRRRARGKTTRTRKPAAKQAAKATPKKTTKRRRKARSRR
jgi:hypothetical protein